ncbi:alpha-L-rhamnosidase C-terminal domain-containing protein [Flavobacterium sp.]|uniref:alpha-L-rhamnosidase-related protein n=1 Tax=Flavobacterium sp. TaxID=239 RepID=UPI003D13B45D
MKSTKLVIILFLGLIFSLKAQVNAWEAKWITDPNCQNASNTWYNFRKNFSLEKVPASAIAKIAVDSKYWLWINGEMVVFEGGLKRGPNPNDTYYDEVDISKYLKVGGNSVSVLAWYFGKDGFSHKSSGTFGFVFECITPEMKILSDESWSVLQNLAYETCPAPFPNFRLSESSIRYDGRQDLGLWYKPEYDASKWRKAKILGTVPMAPWNNLVLRPIPLFKDFGKKAYTNNLKFPIECKTDTIITAVLPANLQITPYLKVEAPDGKLIDIKTDNFIGGSQINMYAEYITRQGEQEYESLGWINGQKVFYSIPKGVKVLDLKYRETGYNTEFAGNFSSSDDFLNRLWQKSLRTLYVTMRDTYMDCPDRERAQWWGDEVTEGGEAFYALDTKSHLLFKKGMYELIGWQRNDNTLFSPIPAGNWDQELPTQMLTAIGYYGFWNYYQYTGDKQAIFDLYEGVQKYLDVWKINDEGTLILRNGGWTWGDWGNDKDMELIFNTTYYMALKGSYNMAILLGKTDDATKHKIAMDNLKLAFNKNFWNGKAYRDPNYNAKTDDRGQALAVVAGLVDADKYPAIFEVLKVEEHASPYMEKYVLEALFQMGYGEYAIERMKKRFGEMVNNKQYSTLFEGWGIGKDGYGGGTTNHAWSGGGLTILSQYLCGIAPIEPGYSVFQIAPQPSGIKEALTTVQTVKGEIKSSFINKNDRFELLVEVPYGTTAVIGIPNYNFDFITANGKKVWVKAKYLSNKKVLKYEDNSKQHIKFTVREGTWKFIATK